MQRAAGDMQMPYSEHSSFAELRAFVAWLRPSAIIPSVGNDRGAKQQRMLQLLRSDAAAGPMDAFLKPHMQERVL